MESESGITEKLVEYKNLDVLTKSELLSNRNNEELQKVADRIQLLEDQFGNLYDSMVEYTHSKAQLRDVGDGFGMTLTQFGAMDQLVSTTNYSMKLLGDAVFSINDKLDSEICVFENKILPIFTSFGSAFKGMRRQWDLANQAESRHSAKRIEYAKFMEKRKTLGESSCGEKEVQLRGKLNQRMTESSLYRRKCVKKFAKLETKRSEALKRIVTKLFRAQASVAARSLELSTEACRTVMSIDIVGDHNKLIDDLNLQASVGFSEDLESDDGCGDADNANSLNVSCEDFTFPEDKVTAETAGSGDSNFQNLERECKKKTERPAASRRHPHKPKSKVQEKKRKHRKS